MTKEKKMFLCIKRGKWSMQITPQTKMGWISFGLWTGLILAIAGLYIWASTYMETIGYSDGQIIGYTLAPFLIVIAIIIFIMIRWMYNRSEIIDAAEITKWEREKKPLATNNNKRAIGRNKKRKLR